MPAANPLPTEPLTALGASLFLSILDYLGYTDLATVPAVCKSWRDHSQTHRSGIWRGACVRAGVASEMVEMVMEVEKINLPVLADLNRPEGSPKLRLDWGWKSLCRQHIVRERNWHNGICQNRWLFPCPNDNLVMDEMGSLCIFSPWNPTGGLAVIDLEEKHVVFAMPGFGHHVQLDYCQGFVLIDEDQYRDDLVIQVYRMESAIRRSDPYNPYAVSPILPPQAATSISYKNPDWRPQCAIRPQTEPVDRAELPDGAMAYYRTITASMSVLCRAKLDREGTERARPVAIIASAEEISVWDLEDASAAPEVYVNKEVYLASVPDAELSDTHLFVIGEEQIHVYSRDTRSWVFSFPPSPLPSPPPYAAAFFCHCDLEDPQPGSLTLVPPMAGRNCMAENRSFQPQIPESQPFIGRIEARGLKRSHPRYAKLMQENAREQLLHQPGWDGVEPLPFYNVRIAGADLICTSRAGYFYITRNIESILATADPAERLERWFDATVIIGMGDSVFHAVVADTRIAALVGSGLVYFDLRDVPDPTSLAFAGDAPAIPIFTVLPLVPRDEGYRVDEEQARCPHFLADKLLFGYGTNQGCCLRALDFAPLGEDAWLPDLGLRLRDD